jgi:Ca-activated chloride channel homolog
MDFLSPAALWLLLLPIILLAGYIWSQRRRHRYTLRYSSASLVREALGKRPGIRRHIPPILFLLGLTALIVAFARPYTQAPLAYNDSTIILAIDVSGSMRANDLKPSRFDAAKAAASDFISKQAANTRIGIVSFSAGAALVQAPTTDHDELNAALDRLYTQRATAIGSGILASLDAIAESMGQDLPSAQSMVPSVQSSPNSSARPTPTPMPSGQYSKAIIVLLSDGQNTTGPTPLDAAAVAVNRGIRIYTIGVGTATGGSVGGPGGGFGGPPPGGFGGGPSGSGGGGFGGGGGFFRAQLDEVTLRQVAKMTGAKYYYAATETDLRDIYAALDTQIVFKVEQIEVTAYGVVAGAILVMLGGILGLFWFNRLP